MSQPMITVPGSSNRVSRDLMLYVALLAGVNIVAAIMLYFFAEGLITSDGPGSIGIAEPEKLYHYSFLWLFANLVALGSFFMMARRRSAKTRKR